MAIETASTYSERTKNIAPCIARRLIEITGDQRDTYFFIQRLSLAVQCGNAASIICAKRERQKYFGNQKSSKLYEEVLVGQVASSTPHTVR